MQIRKKKEKRKLTAFKKASKVASKSSFESRRRDIFHFTIVILSRN